MKLASSDSGRLSDVRDTYLLALLLVRMCIIAIEDIHIAHLQPKMILSNGPHVALSKSKKPRLNTKTTLSFSCVSRTVLPSAFFLQLCPSLRKNLTAFRLKRKREPPAKL